MRALVLIAVMLTACGPEQQARRTPVPHEDLLCWPEEVGDTACDKGTALVCTGADAPRWTQNGTCK